MFYNYGTQRCDNLKTLYESLARYQSELDFKMVDSVLMDIQEILDDLQKIALSISEANDYLKEHYQK